MVKRILILFIIFLIKIKCLSQKTDSLLFNKKNLIIGLGIGAKSHLGNLGITFNYFLINNLSFKVSGGLGMLDYNGALLSAGPEFYKQVYRKLFFSVGSMYSISSRTGAYIEEHVSDNPYYRIRGGAQYWRSFVSIGLIIKKAFVRFDFGYSYILHKPNYSVGGNWKPKYTKDLEKGLGSGPSFNISIYYSAR